jgi:hypothetical protein
LFPQSQEKALTKQLEYLRRWKYFKCLLEMAAVCLNAVHCTLCPFLPTSIFLKPGELHLHQCCGRLDCEGYTLNPAFDILSDCFNHVDHRQPNRLKRWQVYDRWFRVCKTLNRLPVTAAIPGVRTVAPGVQVNVTRYIWSACVLHRVRSTYPSMAWVGFKPPEDPDPPPPVLPRSPPPEDPPLSCMEKFKSTVSLACRKCCNCCCGPVLPNVPEAAHLLPEPRTPLPPPRHLPKPPTPDSEVLVPLRRGSRSRRPSTRLLNVIDSSSSSDEDEDEESEEYEEENGGEGKEEKEDDEEEEKGGEEMDMEEDNDGDYDNGDDDAIPDEVPAKEPSNGDPVPCDSDRVCACTDSTTCVVCVVPLDTPITSLVGSPEAEIDDAVSEEASQKQVDERNSFSITVVIVVVVSGSS